jgi:hypothetical protein
MANARNHEELTDKLGKIFYNFVEFFVVMILFTRAVSVENILPQNVN